MEQSVINEMERVIRKNMAQRGLQSVNLKGELLKSATTLLEGETILIVTGFAIRAALKGETDGPLGAVSLARALELLGKKVVLITDVYTEAILIRCCEIARVNAEVVTVKDENPKAQCENLLMLHKPTHVVAVERPGRAKDGNCYSMKGECISDLAPNTDYLLTIAAEKEIVTIAVGDGGNEVGMGKVASIVKSDVVNGELICAQVSADLLIAAGVSNWGGHAISAALSVLCEKMILHDEQLEVEMLNAMVAEGAVDGCSKKAEATVDGLSLEENLDILRQLRELALIGIAK